MATATELREVIKLARTRFSELKDEYPEVKPYLVFSCPQGQVPIDASPQQILRELPQMVVADANKAAALRIIAELDELKQRRDGGGMAHSRTQDDLANQVRQTETRLAAALERLTYSDEATVEIRLGCLEYERIWELKKEKQVDQELTSPSRASIRIVMGTIGRLNHEHHRTASHSPPA